MTYGNRLDQALTHAKKTRGDLALAIGLTVQSIGQVIKGDTKAFTAENNAFAAKYLRVSNYWLATGKGDMLATEGGNQFTSAANELATLFDMIPERDSLRRARAYSLAVQAIVDVVEGAPETLRLTHDSKKLSA